MVRENRIIYEGAVYHITIRGNNKDYIFENPKHKSFLLKQIKEYNKVFDFELLAYAIMDNHYHLLIKTNKASISEIMFNINNVLGKYLIRELSRTGHVFEKRYNSKLVTTDTYLVWLLRYIHRNPIRAHICNDLNKYRWTSHYFYKQGINSFVNTSFILSILSQRKAAAQMLYFDLVNFEGNDINKKVDIDMIKLKYKLQDASIFTAQQEKIKEGSIIQNNRKSLDEILSIIVFNDEIKNLLKSGSKKHCLTDYKIQFISDAIENKYTFNEIASFLNVNYSSISMLLSRYKKAEI